MSLQEGWQAFEHSHWQSAEQQYIEAMTELEMALSRDPMDMEATSGWIAVHHGFSALYKSQGDARRAFRHLMIPHQSMMSQMSRAECDTTRAQFKKAINQTLPPLLLSSKQQSLCENCRKMLEQSRDLLSDKHYLH